MLTIRTLGHVSIELETGPLHFETRTVAALLIYLACQRNAVSRETLAELFWPERTPKQARSNLRVALHRLRQQVAAYLLITQSGAALKPDAAITVDAIHFERQIAAGHLAEATTLYHNDFLTDFYLDSSPAFEQWALLERERLRTLALAAYQQLIDQHAIAGQLMLATATAQRLLQIDPLHEPTHRQLMRLLAQAGQRSAALAQYETYRNLLYSELTVPPDEATTALAEWIRQGELRITNYELRADTTTKQAFVTRNSEFIIRHNLPPQLTPFIGRSAELGQIAKLLVNPECRLITLLGPGGSGKTRLAIEVAQQQINCYPQGVYFVSLAPIAAIEHVIPAIAEVLQFQFQNDGRSPQVQLCDYLSNKQLLLILDNFEHLIESATLVHELLQSSPGLKCMVTSRERLQLHSETIFVVGSLSFPRDNSTRNVAEYDAIELFVKTARRVSSRFQLEDEHCQAVIQICQLVGGMPLGVILAASWVGIIAPTEIAAELVKGFQFLEVDLQDIPVRQRNMRVMLTYSWQRLTEVERETFIQLAIFRGGFTRSAAQAVSGASLPILARLIDKSFVQRIREDWYELHELLRQYGAKQLSLKPELERSAHDRHCIYYCQLLQQQKGRLKNSEHQQALEEIEANLQNIRIAWQWAVEHDQVDHLIETQESINRFFDCKGMVQEGETVCHQAIVRLDKNASSTNLRLLVQLLTWQGVFNRKIGNVIRGEQLLQQSLAILNGSKLLDKDVRAEKAFVFLLMGGIDREKSIIFRLQSLALYRSIGDKWGAAIALEYLGGAYQMQGNHTRADECLRESLQIREDIEDQIGIAVSHRALGLSAMDRGDYERAEKLVRRGLEIIRPSRNYFEISRILHPLGTVLLRAGKYSESISVIEEFLALRTEQNGMKDSLHIFPSLSDAILHMGQYNQASKLTVPLLENARKIDNRFGIGHCLITLTLLSLTTGDFVQARRMAEESMTLWEEYGYRLFMGHALALLGIAACKQNDFFLAQEALTRAVRIGITQSVILPLTYALPGIALLYTKQNEHARAIEIYTSALCHPHVANSRWFEDIIGRYVVNNRVNNSQWLAPEMIAAAQARGQRRDLWQTAAEVLEQLTTGCGL